MEQIVQISYGISIYGSFQDMRGQRSKEHGLYKVLTLLPTGGGSELYDMLSLPPWISNFQLDDWKATQ